MDTIVYNWVTRRVFAFDKQVANIASVANRFGRRNCEQNPSINLSTQDYACGFLTWKPSAVD